MKTAAFAVLGVLIFALTCVAEDLSGIGLDIVQRKSPNEPLRTKEVYPGSPAEKAGVKPDGFLISVDGTNVVSTSLTEAVKMVRGRVGTFVTIQLADSARTRTNTFTVKRSRMAIVDNRVEFFDR